MWFGHGGRFTSFSNGFHGSFGSFLGTSRHIALGKKTPMESIQNESGSIVNFSRSVSPALDLHTNKEEIAALGLKEGLNEQLAPNEIGRWVRKLTDMDEGDALERGRALAEDSAWPQVDALDLLAERILAHEEF